MTTTLKQDEIIEIYKEVSNKLCNGTEWCWAGVGEPLQLFAKLVEERTAAKEREACAKLCHEIYNAWVSTDDDSDYPDPLDCIRAIRARGQT